MKIDFKKYLKEKNFVNKVYDFIIIGSGPAGVCLYKKILSKKSKKILMIEKGNFVNKKYQKIYYKYLPIKHDSRVFSVGGTSNAWSNFSSYFEKFEMESRWSKKSINLWPFKHKNLLSDYKNLNKNYGFNFEKIKKKRHNLPFERRSFIGSENPKNFRDFIKYNEIDFIFNCDISHIDELDNFSFAYTSRKNIFFKGKNIIICSGGISSVKLIQKSLTNKKLIKIKNKKLIGKFFMDHPKFNLGYLKFPKINLIKKLELYKKDKKIFYEGLSLSSKIQKEKNLLNSYIRFERVERKIDNIIRRLKLLNLINYNNNKYTYKIRLFCEMKPNKNNEIKFMDGKTYVNYNFSANDIKTINLLNTKIIDYFSIYPNRERKIIWNMNNLKNRVIDASHHMGGLIYNSNKNKAVVDKNLKIIGLKNTFICSSSIFPTSGSVNPTMTICVLANRLAKYLITKK